MWILWFGMVHCGNGDTKFVVALFSFFVLGHFSHCCKWSLMCLSIPGHQYDWSIHSLVLNFPSWPYIFQWTSEINRFIMDFGTIITVFLELFLSILLHRIFFQWNLFMQFPAFWAGIVVKSTGWSCNKFLIDLQNESLSWDKSFFFYFFLVDDRNIIETFSR